jgi:hypothetical protein
MTRPTDCSKALFDSGEPKPRMRTSLNSPLLSMRAFGTISATSLKSVIAFSLRKAESSTDIEIGTSRTFSSRFCAVTMISSMPRFGVDAVCFSG